jgi:Fur family peroxide stress response transcriptional regulator
LAADKEHPSAETIFRRVQKKMPTISLDTVYRTLASLEKIGVATRVEASEDKARFDADMTPHNHLICTVCKSISDFSWPEFETLEPPESIEDWGSVSAKNAVLRGVCRTCRKLGEH